MTEEIGRGARGRRRARDAGRVELISSGDAGLRDGGLGLRGLAGLGLEAQRLARSAHRSRHDCTGRPWLFLSILLTEDLIPAYGADCPVAVVHKATCSDQKIVTGTLADILPSQGEDDRDPLTGHDPGRPSAGSDRLRRLRASMPRTSATGFARPDAKGSTNNTRGSASDLVRRAPTAAARNTGLACAETFQ
jgi:hypothetical protein